MSSSAELHLIYRMANADVRLYPFPHFYVENVFPPDFYAQLRACFPQAESMPQLKSVRPVGPAYSAQRLCIPLAPETIGRLPVKESEFWTQTAQWLLGNRFFSILIQKFQPFLMERFKDQPNVSFLNEGLLVDDHTRYALGPHSDSPKKVITLLFYLPGDLSQEHLGTSIYVPRDPNFRCYGGPHYSFDQFEQVYTAPFRPNTLFGFVKTANSFHGVEPLNEDESCRRQLLLYDVNVPPQFGLGVAAGATPAQHAAPASSKPNVVFSF